MEFYDVFGWPMSLSIRLTTAGSPPVGSCYTRINVIFYTFTYIYDMVCVAYGMHLERSLRDCNAIND